MQRGLGRVLLRHLGPTWDPRDQLRDPGLMGLRGCPYAKVLACRYLFPSIGLVWGWGSLEIAHVPCCRS